LAKIRPIWSPLAGDGVAILQLYSTKCCELFLHWPEAKIDFDTSSTPPFYKKLQLLVMVIKASQLGRQQKEIFVGMPVRLGCTGFQSSARALSWLRAV
jgi:hypothetical protein